MLVGGVVDHHLGDHANAPIVRGGEKILEVLQRSVRRMNRSVVCNVVSIVTQWRRIEREKPDSVYAELLQIVELAGQPAEIADPVRVTVAERAHMELVDNRILVPEVFVLQEQGGILRVRL